MDCPICKKGIKDCTCKDIDLRIEKLLNNPNFLFKFCSSCEKHAERCKCQDPVFVRSTDGEPWADKNGNDAEPRTATGSGKPTDDPIVMDQKFAMMLLQLKSMGIKEVIMVKIPIDQISLPGYPGVDSKQQPINPEENEKRIRQEVERIVGEELNYYIKSGGKLN